MWSLSNALYRPRCEVLEREGSKVVLRQLGAVLVRQHDAVGHVAQRLLDQPDRERGIVLADLAGVAYAHELGQALLDARAEDAVEALRGGLGGDARELDEGDYRKLRMRHLVSSK